MLASSLLAKLKQVAIKATLDIGREVNRVHMAIRDDMLLVKRKIPISRLLSSCSNRCVIPISASRREWMQPSLLLHTSTPNLPPSLFKVTGTR